MAHTYNPNTEENRRITNPRLAWATQQDSVSKQKEKEDKERRGLHRKEKNPSNITFVEIEQ